MFNKLLSWFHPTRSKVTPHLTEMDRHISSLLGGDAVKRAIGEQTCPSCRCRINAGATIHGQQRDRPHPSDLGLCYHCGAVLEFDLDFNLRLVRDKSWAALPRDVQEEIIKAQGQVTLPGITAQAAAKKAEEWED